eukprot:658574-Pyramimonas_sp.AAC.1
MRLTSSIPAPGKHVAYQLRDLGHVYEEALEVLGGRSLGPPCTLQEAATTCEGCRQSSPTLRLATQS